MFFSCNWLIFLCLYLFLGGGAIWYYLLIFALYKKLKGIIFDLNWYWKD